MDADRFDRLSKTLSRTGSRRTLLHLLTALPLAGALAALLGEESAGKGRRERRKNRHRQEQNKRQQRRRHDEQHRDQQQRKEQQQNRDKKRKRNTPEPGCQPASKAQTCTGKCASVTDNCGTLIDCGPCACDPTCGACFTCDPATGSCIPDDTQLGGACGQPGQVCQDDGSCACTPGGTTCGVCRDCQG